MPLHRDSGPSPQRMQETSASVTDIGRSLRTAREQARLTTAEAADRAGLTQAEVEDLESGEVGRLRDRVETLRSLSAYAGCLGLPGHDYVLAVIHLWPTAGALPARGPDSGPVPVVSVTTAPAGGHTPAAGADWPADQTGTAGFSVTGVVSPLGTLPVGDGATATSAPTDHSPAFDTGEIPAIKSPWPRSFKVLIGMAAVLVALGIFTLVAHSHFSGWSKQLRADTTQWGHDLKQAVGLAPKTKAPASTAPGARPNVVMVADAGRSLETVNVHASSFTVKMVAFKGPSWMQVTDSSQQAPIYQQVLPTDANQSFTVTHSLTIETGSAAARAYLYDGTDFIGFFFPSKAPFTMTFNAVG